MKSVEIQAEGKICKKSPDFIHVRLDSNFFSYCKHFIEDLSSKIKMIEFKIAHNFGFGNYNMVAEITDCIPPNKICLWEYCIDDKKKGFPHKVEFRIEPKGGNCILNYRVSGTYGGKVQDMSFKPILKGVIIEELLKIKNAIESSEKVPKPLTSETVKPI